MIVPSIFDVHHTALHREHLTVLGIMSIVNIGNKNNESNPVEMYGTPAQATAFLDFFWQNVPHEQLSIVISGNYSKVENFRARTDLLALLKKNGNVIEKIGDGPIYMIRIDRITDEVLSCQFGYVERGISIQRHPYHPDNVNVHVWESDAMSTIVEQSLGKLYQMTGLAKFAASLVRHQAKKFQTILGVTSLPQIDPEYYFGVLGLDANAHKHMPLSLLAQMVAGMKPAVEAILESETFASAYERAHYLLMLAAIENLSDQETLENYLSRWVKPSEF